LAVSAKSLAEADSAKASFMQGKHPKPQQENRGDSEKHSQEME